MSNESYLWLLFRRIVAIRLGLEESPPIDFRGMRMTDPDSYASGSRLFSRTSHKVDINKAVSLDEMHERVDEFIKLNVPNKDRIEKWSLNLSRVAEDSKSYCKVYHFDFMYVLKPMKEIDVKRKPMIPSLKSRWKRLADRKRRAAALGGSL